MKNKAKYSPLRMADGGVVPAPVSPYSIRGIGNSIAGAYDSITKPFRPPPGYVPAIQERAPVAPAAAVVPAPVAPRPQLGGMNTNAISRREAAAGLADGGVLGGLRDAYDSITKPFRSPPGYVSAMQEQRDAQAAQAAQAAKAPPLTPPTKQLGGMQMDVIKKREAAAGLKDGAIVPGKRNGNKDTVDAKLTPGEGVLPVDTVDAMGGPEAVQDLIDRTHTPVEEQGIRGGYDGYADGGFPGIDVEERRMTARDARMFARDPGPGNPNVGARPAPAAPVAAAPPVAPPQGGAYRAGRAASGALRAAGPLAVGAELVSNFGDNKISQEMDPTDSSAMGTIRYLRNGDFAGAGRSLKKGAVETGMDLATGAANIADVFVPGQPFSTGLRERLQSDLGPGLQTATPAPTTPRAAFDTLSANPTDQRLAAGTQTTQPSYVPGTNVQRNGNSFSNTGEFQTGPGVNSVSTDPSAMERTQRAAAITAETDKRRMGLRDYGDMDYYTTGAGANGGAKATIINASPLGFRQEDPSNPSASLSTLDRGNLSARQRATFDANATANERNNATLRENNQRTTDASIRNANLEYGSARARDEVTMRGQDVGARTSAAKARQDQANSDRQFQLETQKFGVDVAEKNRAARSSSEESTRKQLETRFRTQDPKTGQDVPDTAKVAAFTTAMAATVPRMIEQLEATGTPAAAAKAKELRSRGAAALEAGDMDGLQRLFDQRERFRAAKGAGPNQGNFTESDNLLDYRQTGTEKRVLGGDRVVTPAASASIRDLEYADGPANAFMPDWFKTRTNNLTRGIRE